MLYTWKIVVDGKVKGVVRSSTKQGAIDQYYMTYGSASAYSGVGRRNISAIKI
jgi:hypothetical protein